MLVAAAAWVSVSRLSLSYDLAYFLPRPVTEAQKVLVDRVGQGPGSRVMFVVLPGASTVSRDAIGDRLAALGQVRSVLPRPLVLGIEAIPPPVLANRYLLVDVDTSVDGLTHALRERLRDLAMMDDAQFLDLVAVDPYLASVRVLERLTPAPADGDYRLEDGTPFLLLQTRPPAFDLAAQQRLVSGVRAAVAAVDSQIEPRLYGAGAYGIRLQQAVSREATLFSLAAAGALGVLLWVAYRSLTAVLLAALPLAAGGMAGLAALALVFPQVHGITLAFGFTLMGVTVDYGLHVLSHLRHGRRQLAGVWPTLLLSAASTALAFLAFTLSGSRGLVQLGIFSAVGIVTAVVFAWLLLPRLAVAMDDGDGGARERLPVPVSDVRYRYWPLLACLAVGAAALTTHGRVWNDDLSALTPVPPQTLAVDRRLRQRTGAPDIRYLAVTRGDHMTAVLGRVRDLERTLIRARADGVIDGYQAVTALVPDPDTQQRRRTALAPEGLSERVQQATTGLGFRPAALQPFVVDVERTASSKAVVEPQTYAGTGLAELVNGMLYQDADDWIALTFLSGLHDPAALNGRLQALTGTVLVDLQSASRSLLATYRLRLLEILGGALAAVALVLAVALRSWRRLVWVTGTLVASVALTVAVVSRLLGSLSLFDLVAATLVAGLGLDYALFFSRRPGDGGDYQDTVHAVGVCFASTAVVFGLLGASSIPVLHGIGVTVATGVAVAYVLAWFGRYPVNPDRPPDRAAAAPGPPPRSATAP